MGWRIILESMRRDWYNIPNLLSLIRLICGFIVPVILLANPVPNESWWWAFWLFATLALTDKLDGYIARRWNLITPWGKVLDPIADKMLVLPTLVVLCFLLSSPWLWIATIVMVAREVHVTMILKRGAYACGEILSARQSGRVKMVLQGMMIAVLLIPTISMPVANFLVIITTLVALYSWWDYWQAAKPQPVGV